MKILGPVDLTSTPDMVRVCLFIHFRLPHQQNTHLCLEHTEWFLERFCQYFTQEESVSLTLRLLQDVKQSTVGGNSQQIDLKRAHQYALAH